MWLLPAGAEDKPPEQLTLTMSAADAMLIVQALGGVSCATAAQRTACDHAVDLLTRIREQAAGQVK